MAAELAVSVSKIGGAETDGDDVCTSLRAASAGGRAGVLGMRRLAPPVDGACANGPVHGCNRVAFNSVWSECARWIRQAQDRAELKRYTNVYLDSLNSLHVHTVMKTYLCAMHAHTHAILARYYLHTFFPRRPRF